MYGDHLRYKEPLVLLVEWLLSFKISPEASTVYTLLLDGTLIILYFQFLGLIRLFQ